MTWRRVLGRIAPLALALVTAACGDSAGGGGDCTVGSEACACTPGGGCDPGLQCLSGVCVNPNSTSASASETDSTSATASASASGTGSASATTTATTTSATSADSTSADGGTLTSGVADTGPLLDVAGNQDLPGGACVEAGCKQVDMLFALDSSLSMMEEIDALAAEAAFADIVTALASLNCGDIDYRIGLTNDNDGGFIGWNGQDWFDSQMMTDAGITTSFSNAAATVLGNGGTGLGCEHVLSSSADLLASDNTGFLRPDALLVLVLVTDVDDFGVYDQAGWPDCDDTFFCPCDMLCMQSGQPVMTIYDNLVALKGGDATAVASIVVAGDPTVMAGMNFCGQPASCCGNLPLGECGQAHHADRLYEFASLHTGTNGYTADICAGGQAVPSSVEDALGDEIDLACQVFEPAG